jgi:hypothetical protein
MRVLAYSLLIVTGFPPGDIPRTASTEIRARAQPASVELSPLSDDGRPVRLPALEFALRIEPTCGGDAEPRSLSISVADTRLHFPASDLQGTPTVETTLTLPERQLAPVRIDDFCRVGKDDVPTRFLLEDAYTARLSLRCGLDEGQTIVYATLPLDVDLRCRRANEEVLGPDQVPAPDDPSESL